MSKKSMVEEALLQIKDVENAINKNAEGILSSIMKKEISSLVKESLMEQEEIETPETTELPTDPTMSSDELSVDEPEMIDGDSADIEGDELEFDDMDGVEEIPADDETVDLTGASDAEVLKVFKAMGDNDGIVVTKDDNIITLNDGDDEYIIKINEQLEKENMEKELEEMFNEEWDDMDDFELEDDMEDEELYEFEDEDFMRNADKNWKHKMSGPDFSDEDEDEFDFSDEDEDEFDFSDEDEDEFDFSDEDEDEDEIIYEVELDDEEDEEDDEEEEDEDFVHESKSFKPKGMVGKLKKVKFEPNTKGGFNEKKKEAFGKGTKATGTGKAKFEYKDGENLDGEFKVKPKKVEAKEASRFVKSIDRKVKRGLMAAPSQIKEEVTELKRKNNEYKMALDVFRSKLNEVVVFNSNLAYATKLFTEHSTTKQEKLNILRRFDNVESLKESKNLYRTIKNEISSSTINESVSLNESIERKVSKNPVSGSAVNLIESKTYENPQFLRIKDLMSKI